MLDAVTALTVDDEFVRETACWLDTAGIPDQVEAWAAMDAAGPGGRPETFPKRAIIIAMFVAARLEMPMAATVWMNLLCHAFSPTVRTELGLPDLPDLDQPKARKAFYRNVRTRFHAVERLMDFSEVPKNRRLTPEEAAERGRTLSPERKAELVERQTWFFNQVVRISHRQLPEHVWAQWKGGVAVDATAVATYARGPKTRGRGRQKQVLRTSTDPEAGFYVREGDHADIQLPNGSFPKKILYGYEQTLAFMAASTAGEEGLFPTLLLGGAPPHVPGASPGRNGYAAILAASEATSRRGLLACDNAYVNALPEEFALRVQALGYQYVIDYNKNQLGHQGSHEGALLVEGWWYCPATPQALVDATADLRSGLITEDVWRIRLEERRAFAFRAKESKRPDGSQRLLCPAAGVAPTARCTHKTPSMHRRHLGNRRVDLNHLLETAPPKACKQHSITVKPGHGGRFAQSLRYGSEEWRLAYQTLRASNEGGNGIVKDPIHQDLENAGKRRIRGQAANALITCFQHAASNLRQIASFLRNAVVDDDGVMRRPRIRRKKQDKQVVPRADPTVTTPPPPAAGPDPPG